MAKVKSPWLPAHCPGLPTVPGVGLGSNGGGGVGAKNWLDWGLLGAAHCKTLRSIALGGQNGFLATRPRGLITVRPVCGVPGAKNLGDLSLSNRVIYILSLHILIVLKRYCAVY